MIANVPFRQDILTSWQISPLGGGTTVDVKLLAPPR
jgi:hypothetical protein